MQQMATMVRSGDSAGELEVAAKRLYDAEVAFHIARQTGVDPWIKAAADKLHDAVVAHRATQPSAV